MCGSISDGCGGALECGGCGAGEQCTAVGACAAVPTSCTPKTCAELGASCGPKDNGCGGQLSCGTCATGQTCDAAGACEVIPPNCTPKTCAAAGASCGALADGCGATLHCGACAAGKVCGSDAACHDAPAPGGTTAWVTVRPSAITGVSADAAGTLFIIGGSEGPQYGSMIERIGADGSFGSSLSSVEWISNLLASPTRDQLLLAGADQSQAAPPNSLIRTANKALTAANSIVGGADVDSHRLLAASPTGRFAEYHGVASWGSFEVRNADGSLVFSLELENKLRVHGAGFDTAGNAIFGGELQGQLVISGQTFGADGKSTPAVLKVSPTGALIWGRTVATTGGVVGLGVTSLGTAVALVRHSGAFSFAGSSSSHTAALSLVVYESSGEERGATLVTTGETKRAFLAVDPIGRAFVAHGPPTCDSTTVTKLNLAGAKEWTRTLRGVSSCDQSGFGGYGGYDGSASTDLTVSNHAAVLSGYFAQPVDFGMGPVTPNPKDGFLLKLRP